MKRIKLTQGKFTLVDDKDFEYLNQFKWHCLNIGYAARREFFNDGTGRSKYVYMHNDIMKPGGSRIDHINADKLDNRRENLRFANCSQNQANRPNLNKNNTSGYKGVSWNKKSQKWRAYITVNRKYIHLGHHLDLGLAALAYNQAARQYFGEFAYLNQI